MPTFVVQNAGQVGLQAIKSLVAAGHKVRTASRNVEKCKEKVPKGVEVFESDDYDIFEGADGFVCIPPGGTKDPDARAEIALDFLRMTSVEKSIKHGSILSVVAAENQRGVFGKQFGSVEKFASSLKRVSTTIVRAPFFLENLWGDAGTVKSHDTFYAPIDGDTKQLMAAVADVGDAVAAAAMNAEKFAGKIVHVIGANVSKNEIAALYSKKLGRDIKFVQASEEAATKAFEPYGMPAWQVKGVIELFGINETDAFVKAHENEFEELVKRKPMSVATYINTVLAL